MVTIGQINDHVRTYPDPNPETGNPWTTAERVVDIEQLQAELDALEPQPDPVELQAARDRAEAVNAWLSDLAVSDPVQFESVRRLSFDDLAARAGM